MAQEQQSNANFCGAVGRALLLPLHAIVYVFNPCNWCNSSNKVKRDARVALKEVVDGYPRVCLHAEMLRSSTELGMKILKVESGFVAFSIPRCFSSKVNKLKQKEIDDLQREHPNIKLSKEDKTAIIEIDIVEIQRGLHSRKAIINQIAGRICSDLKALTRAGIEKVSYGDMKLIYSIAKALHDSHNYTRSEEKEIFTKSDGAMVICIANKGIVSLGGRNHRIEDNKKNRVSLNEPGSSMSNVTASSFYVKHI